MVRSQVLLTKQQVKEIEELSDRKGLSKSKMIRQLLDRALYVSEDEAAKKSGKYIFNLNVYQGSNPRIVGLKELFTVGANMTEVYIIDSSVFEYYQDNKSFPKEFEWKLLEIGRQLKEISLTKKLVLRRAYVVPGLDNPPGPRFLGIEPDELLSSLEELYQFAIESNYHIKDGAEISAFIYPFADPEPLETPVSSSATLPYGGYSYPLNNQSTRVEVLAVWGNNEGVQSFDAVDRYIVDTDQQVILEKNVPQKSVMLATTKDKQSQKLDVPIDKQFEQVLNDFQILETARIVRSLGDKYGPRRVEFSFDGRESLEYNESTEYKIKRVEQGKVNLKGNIVRITSEDDLDKIENSSSFAKKHILYIDKKIVEERAYDVLNSIAGLPRKHTVFYPGLSSTAHAMRVLTDFGHRAIVVGNRIFEEGEEILIKTDRDGDIIIKKLDDTTDSNLIHNLYDTKLFGLNMVGGKALNLSRLKTQGFNVPHGVVLTTEFFNEVLKRNNLTVEEVLDKGRHLKIKEDLWSRVVESGLFDKEKIYSVRSSGTVEDHREHSFAGQFDTVLNVEFAELKEAVERVINSISNESVRKYIDALDMELNLKMPVVVQEMIDPAYAGVIFSKDVGNMNSDRIVIEMTPGIGEGVVDGTSRSTKAIYSRDNGELVQEPDLDLVSITKPEVNALVEMAQSVERLMGGYQDIEWAIDKEGRVWLLQSRDM